MRSTSRDHGVEIRVSLATPPPCPRAPDASSTSLSCDTAAVPRTRCRSSPHRTPCRGSVSLPQLPAPSTAAPPPSSSRSSSSASLPRRILPLWLLRGRLSFRWRRACVRVLASGGGGRRRECLYKVLGVPPSAAPGEIKRAYRRLALKYHPVVNKELPTSECSGEISADQARVQHADEFGKSKYASSNPDSSWTSGSSKSADAEEQFYGFADFLKDLQSEFQNWEAGLNSEQKPKSLWEELGVTYLYSTVACCNFYCLTKGRMSNLY